jgi:hypothetical protein
MDIQGSSDCCYKIVVSIVDNILITQRCSDEGDNMKVTFIAHNNLLLLDHMDMHS